MTTTPSSISRRSFVKTGAAAFGAVIVPRHVLGGPGFIPPSDRLNLACIGVGSQGMRVMLDLLAYEEIRVACVCDVNTGSGDYVEWGEGELRRKIRELLGDPAWGEEMPGAWAGLQPAADVVNRYYGDTKCATYVDFRDLLEKEDVDAVVVCTPDHLHAPISVAAMGIGKHVFCQKPMAHTLEESRAMAATARRTGVATQVATGNSASEDTRVLTEWIAAGAIGPVRQVYNWSSRPFWPQGIETPKESDPVPNHLNWDLWLGPAPFRPYNEIYQPFVWRGWFDFGCGAIGDMGCYSFDTLFRVLNLQAPERIEASSTPVFPETYPQASVIHFRFPARDDQPSVDIHWYDGGIKPPKPSELEGDELPTEGMLFVGDSGKILCGFNGGNPRLIPESAMAAFEAPPATLPRSPGHYEEWIAGAKGGPAPAANFEFAGMVTDAVLLGNVAVRTGKTIYWDGGTVTQPSDANTLLSMPYRSGWTL